MPSLSPDGLRRALDYPYRIPATSFSFSPADGATRKIASFQIAQARIVSQAQGVTTYDIDAVADGVPLHLQNVCPVIASGSNASPDQLMRKFNGRTKAPIHSMLCEFNNLIPVFSSHFAAYGAISACLWRQGGARGHLFVNLLGEAELARMHETESLGVEFNFVQLEFAQARQVGRLNGAPLALDFHYYDSIHGPLLDAQARPIVVSSFAVTQHGLETANEEEVLTAALRELFPGKPRDEAIAEIVHSPETRRAAADNLKTLRLRLGG
ncbi:MAG TPA: hypothetical protein VFC54_03735 [Pseudolabrys sp.]|nr:hypothetical protein [Pseudolabrys sp.]